jgi:hypothetical protein
MRVISCGESTKLNEPSAKSRAWRVARLAARARVHIHTRAHAGFLRKPRQNFLRKFVSDNVILLENSRFGQGTRKHERFVQGSRPRLRDSVLGFSALGWTPRRLKTLRRIAPAVSLLEQKLCFRYHALSLNFQARANQV